MENSKNRRRRIIVDIDNTLWHLAPELWEELKKMNPEMPPPEEWDSRRSIERFMPIKEFFRVLKVIHMRQEIYPPLPDAEYFLRALKERGFYIVIASHRSPETYEPTVNWMQKHRLAHDEIHLSYDKSVLFPGSIALVDDSPINLSKALEAGILGTGLLFPWNENSGFPLFKTLSEVLGYLDSKLG
jgi:HAD superfamily hydrolase (TIGR01509 family)